MDAATSVNPSFNGLVAVFLLTRSRPGPKLIFHYPASPGISTGTGHDGSNGHGFDSDLESDGEVTTPGRKRQSHGDRAGKATANGLSQLSSDETYGISEQRVLSYSIESLERLFSPGRWSDRKKFEVCLDGVTFVGHPVYATGEGDWSDEGRGDADEQQREAGHCVKDASSASASGQRPPAPLDDGLNERHVQTASITITAPEVPVRADDNSFTHVPDSLNSQLATSLGTSMNSNSTASGIVSEPLTMFHVVFAMKHDSPGIGSDMYHQVAKKLSKALHYCQKHNSFVASESRKMLALQARARQTRMSIAELWTQMTESSELAWVLKELYEKLAMGDVAGIRLNGNEMSLYCTLNPSAVEQGLSLGPQSGLLLLQDKEILIRELQRPEASPLAFFIRQHTPTKTLQQLSTRMAVPVSDIVYLARHLIKWRKARPIAPLHPRNTYVISPNAPIGLVPELAPLYTRRFPALRPLPQLLNLLSGRPIRFNLLIPSKDHRQAYVDVLAFLMKHGFVRQLRTLGWLKYLQTSRDRRTSSGVKDRQKNRLSGGGISLLSPHLRPTEPMESEPSSDVVSVSSERSAITAVAAESPRSKIMAQLKADAGVSYSLILSPERPTAEESRVMGRIRDSIEDAELREQFMQLSRYLDGEHTLEDIAATEGLKRARVEEWLALLDGGEHLLIFRSL